MAYANLYANQHSKDRKQGVRESVKIFLTKLQSCPNKNKYKENKDEKAQVRRVVIPNPLPPQVVQGKIGYHCCSMLLDSGVDITGSKHKADKKLHTM